MSITVRPITARFGAEVSGVDISLPLDAATARKIVDIQNRWGVTVWRDTGLDDAGHVAFTRIFGDVIHAPPHKEGPRFSQPELFDASNIDRQGNILNDEKRRITNRGNRLWHIDSSFMAVRAAQSLLLCHEAPPHSAPTWFADARSAYDDLPQTMKDRIEGLQARHCYFWSRRKAGYPYTEKEIDGFQHATHPLVNIHPGSGRKALYIGAHARDIVGMERDEGRELLDELTAWATQPQYILSIEYSAGDMTIWDNLCSLHRAGDFDETLYRRDMRRTTIRDPRSPGAPGDVVQDMFRPAKECTG
ncbi:MAG: TauD/TfdA family dioxygenase [Candidatus Andeanibacterium colombiense]|uniref:TauD/TfdA family dioxygenase n=1 Tax=Candidatus Andeanibacterium colombiense TaxID=3121345 RepID=A0AAJ6BNG6_9SPHN|nr:MAG: TauD/TfdA family dioxygenase [Sphingomonadaceae bacterium]